MRARVKRCRKQAWQRAWESIRRCGPGRGSRQAVQVGVVGGGIDMVVVGMIFFWGFWFRCFWLMGCGWLMVDG